MDLQQLEMFHAIVETGTITAAARKIHRVPSNLTTRIRQLEQSLGTALFIRENQRLRLSPAGHNFLLYSRKILQLVEEARAAVSGDRLQGRLAIGALESTAAVRIPTFLAMFHQRHPALEIALSTGPSGKMVDGVLDGQLAAAFVDGPLHHPALGGQPVFQEEMVIVAPLAHPPINDAITVDGCNVFAFRENCSYRRHFERWFDAGGARPGKIYEMESYHGMLACVIAGSGLALMPRSMLESMPGSHQTNAWPLPEEWQQLTTWLIWRHDTQTRQLDAFRELLPTPESP